MRAARALQQGQEPLAPHHPETFLIRSGAVKVAQDRAVKEVMEETLPNLVPVG